MKFDIEASLGYTKRKYKTEAGNGTAIPEHKQDANLHRMIPIKKKDGHIKTTNLYLKIQQAKSSTDYKKFIQDLDIDLEAAKMIFQNLNPQEAFANAVDSTNFGKIEDYKALENHIIGKFGSLDNYYKFVDTKLAKYNAQIAQSINAKKSLELQAKKAAENKKKLEDNK